MAIATRVGELGLRSMAEGEFISSLGTLRQCDLVEKAIYGLLIIMPATIGTSTV